MNITAQNFREHEDKISQLSVGYEKARHKNVDMAHSHVICENPAEACDSIGVCSLQKKLNAKFLFVSEDTNI